MGTREGTGPPDPNSGTSRLGPLLVTTCNSLHLVCEATSVCQSPRLAVPCSAYLLLPATLLVSPGPGVVPGHLGQLLLTVEGHELHPAVGSILEAGDRLARVGVDDA